MSNENYEFRLLNAILFENWLRFYFLLEQVDQQAIIFISDSQVKDVLAKYPQYQSIIMSLNKQKINLERSREAVLGLFSASELPAVYELLNTPKFSQNLDKMHGLIQEKADFFDEGFKDFEIWWDLFQK